MRHKLFPCRRLDPPNERPIVIARGVERPGDVRGENPSGLALGTGDDRMQREAEDAGEAPDIRQVLRL